MSVVVIYDLPQTIPFNWYITCGLWSTVTVLEIYSIPTMALREEMEKYTPAISDKKA